MVYWNIKKFDSDLFVKIIKITSSAVSKAINISGMFPPDKLLRMSLMYLILL